MTDFNFSNDSGLQPIAVLITSFKVFSKYLVYFSGAFIFTNLNDSFHTFNACLLLLGKDLSKTTLNQVYTTLICSSLKFIFKI